MSFSMRVKKQTEVHPDSGILSMLKRNEPSSQERQKGNLNAYYKVTENNVKRHAVCF